MDQIDRKFFNEEFKKSRESVGKINHALNSGSYMEFAVRVKALFAGRKDLSLLDVGCGLGYRTLNYMNMKFSAYGCDGSDWAYLNSVLPDGRHYLSDIRDVGRVIQRSFDVICVERVFEYVEDADIERGLNGLAALLGGQMILSYICSDHSDRNVVMNSMLGRLSVCPKSKIEDMFMKCGLVVDVGQTASMTAGGWDGIWVLNKASGKSFGKSTEVKVTKSI